MEGNRYRLVRAIATGGMARVDEGRLVGEGGFERKVAIKRVLPEFAQRESMRRMFFDEASIASRLHHGNIVQVLDYGTVDGSEFIAMELVDGLDANSAFRMGEERGESLPAAVALYVIAETAYALEYAHAAGVNHDDVTGVVHRDVSPHNILLSWDGDVKLSDFGIAFAETKSERTRTGVIKGKFSFMAPEQAAGKRVDGAADVYALGVTLRLLLGAGTEVDRDASGVALYLDEVHEDLAVQTLLKSMLSLDPGSRPSAGDVAKEAGAFAASAMQGAGRGELKAWLSRVRRERQASALDDLMGLVLVPTGDGRAFTAVRVQGEANEEVSGEGPTTPFAGESRPESRSERVGVAQPKVRRHSGWTAVSVMAVFGLATVVYLYWGDEGGEIHPRPAESSVAVVPSVIIPADAAAADSSVSELSLESDAALDESERERPARRIRRSSTAARAEPRQPIVAMEVMEAPTTLDFGYIRVPRAAGAGREQVLVDGRSMGFTPRVIRVRAGARRLLIRNSESGEIVFSSRLRVGPEHSRVSPLAVRR